MKPLSVGDPAPGFELPDSQGALMKLTEITQEKNVLLVFNLGFA